MRKAVPLSIASGQGSTWEQGVGLSSSMNGQGPVLEIGWAKTFNVFNNGPITKGPLTAWACYYSTPAGSFPTSHSLSNLFADVVFNAPR